MKRKPLVTKESSLQAYVVDLMRFFGVPGLIYFHPVNEGRRAERTGAFLKRIGMVAGVADLAIVLPGAAARFLELKTETGRTSKEQRAFRDLCERNGTPYAIARSPEEAYSILHGWGAVREDLSVRPAVHLSAVRAG